MRGICQHGMMHGSPPCLLPMKSTQLHSSTLSCPALGKLLIGIGKATYIYSHTHCYTIKRTTKGLNLILFYLRVPTWKTCGSHAPHEHTHPHALMGLSSSASHHALPHLLRNSCLPFLRIPNHLVSYPHPPHPPHPPLLHHPARRS